MRCTILRTDSVDHWQEEVIIHLPQSVKIISLFRHGVECGDLIGSSRCEDKLIVSSVLFRWSNMYLQADDRTNRSSLIYTVM